MDEIIRLHNEGKSIREISELVSVPKSTVQRIVSQIKTDENGTVSETVKSRCPLGLDPNTCERHKEKNSVGVVKLRVCDYNLLEQDNPYFKDMPFWDCT